MDCGRGTNANTAVAMCVGASRPGQWRWRWRAKWTVVIALLLGIFHAAQAADQVLVILSSDTPPYSDFLAGLRSRLDSFALPRLTLQAVMASDYDQSGAWQTPATAPKLIVTVGTGAAEMLLHTPNTIPTHIPRFSSINRLAVSLLSSNSRFRPPPGSASCSAPPRRNTRPDC